MGAASEVLLWLSVAIGVGSGLWHTFATAWALILLLALGVFHARQRANDRYLLLAAAGVYALALVFRTIDHEVCSAFPIGTHFLWHTLIGLAAYLSRRGLILSRPSRVRV